MTNQRAYDHQIIGITSRYLAAFFCPRIFLMVGYWKHWRTDGGGGGGGWAVDPRNKLECGLFLYFLGWGGGAGGRHCASTFPGSPKVPPYPLYMSFSLLIIFNGRNSWKDRPTGSTGALMGEGASFYYC